MLDCFFSQHMIICYFYDFSLYLDCIEVYLDFNYNYNLVLTKKNFKNYIFLIKRAREPICGGSGQIRIFLLVNR